MKNDQLIYIKANLAEYNRFLQRKTPAQIIRFVLSFAERPVLTSNFGPNSASLIHAVSTQRPGIPLVWCDTGFNTPDTIAYAEKLDSLLPFALHRCDPAPHGFGENIPNEEDEDFLDFVQAVKLKPFKKALNKHKPDVWFTNIRKGQTAYRDSLDILSINKEGLLKVSPFYNYSDLKIQAYLRDHNLPNEFNYYDPTKPKSNSECGIQLA
ncbi:MAG: phosphoadenosine phosphosulfate reductase family protein [Leeuwenhoekiella sp.]